MWHACSCSCWAPRGSAARRGGGRGSSRDILATEMVSQDLFHRLLLLPAHQVVEAEAMAEAEGGITDLLLSNEVVAPRKIDRLVGLAAAGGSWRCWWWCWGVENVAA